MTLVILLSISGYRRMEERYARLLARYTRLQADGKHGIAPEEWVNAAGERYVHRSEVISELRALHIKDTEDPA